MENTEARVLAYTLATEIHAADLEQVSGGGGSPCAMSSAPSGGCRASNGQWECSIDWVLDA